MKKFFIILAILMFSAQVKAGEVPNLPADIALHRLKEGNYRFANYQMKHPNINKTRRDKLIIDQHPFAVVLSCSDSRIVPEMIFDQGLGDIFVIRNAGNDLDEHVMGSIDYAMRHLGVKLIVILGHEYCGAVGAAMKGDKESPEIESLLESIKPAVDLCKKENRYTYENVIKAHAILDVKDIVEDKDLGGYINKHGVKVIPAYYSIDSGEVNFLN